MERTKLEKWKEKKKNPDINQQQIQPKCKARSGNRNQPTAAGGEFSHHMQCLKFKITGWPIEALRHAIFYFESKPRKIANIFSKRFQISSGWNLFTSLEICNFLD